jgi:hypothetical protein
VEKYLLDEGKIVRFLVGARPRTPCRIILKIRDFTRFMPIYTFINFILNKEEKFQTNSSLHGINATNKHRQNVNLSCSERSTF